MLLDFFYKEMKAKYPKWKVSKNFYEAKDNVLAIYDEAGGEPDPNNETNPLTPEYMFFISSTNFGEAERIAWEIFKLYHMNRDRQIFDVTTPYGVTFRVRQIRALQTNPNRLGVEDGNLQFTLNFQANIKEVI